jgi:glycosyltransferase involved in cell wall biosynthesis
MRVLIVSGIWPPDVGGPASHAPDIADYLQQHGHDIEVVVTADSQPEPRAYPVQWLSRRVPKGVIHVIGASAIARAARRADVVYTTGMFARTAVACAIARRPYVVKLTGDPAFERARAGGRVTGDVEEFERKRGAYPVLLRMLRRATLSRAAHVLCPSAFLRALAISWGIPADRVSVLPNATPPLPELPPRDELRSGLRIEGPTLAFAGRFVPQKALDVALAAVARVDGVSLLLAGDGTIRSELEAQAAPLGARVRFVGSLSRQHVLELFAAADASLLPSAWENFPHTVVEALAVGTPVIATRVGGVPEVVEDGVNGLLVQAHDIDALANAIRRFFTDDALRARLRAAAAPSVERYAEGAVYGELERILVAAAR